MEKRDKDGNPEQSEKVRAYLAELVEVGKRHGLTLTPESSHDAFTVGERTADENWNNLWLLSALDQTGGAS